MINVFDMYRKGLSEIWENKSLLFWLYGFNLLFAYLLALPVSMMFGEALDQTVAAEKLLAAFDLTLLASIISKYGAGISLNRLILTFGLLYFLLNIFFTGGIISHFARAEKFNFRKFITGCTDYIGRFFRLFLISFLFLLGVLILFVLFSKLSGWITEGAATEHSSVILFAIRLIIIGILLAMINMLFDYAKIITVVNNHTKMFRTVKSALGFVFSHSGRTILLFSLFLLTALIIMSFYYLIESVIHVNSGLMIMLFFLWSQIYVLAKLWIRLSFFAGQYLFYDKAMIRNLPEPVELLEAEIWEDSIE